MLLQTDAIVLSKIKYGDSNLIVKCFTLQNGIVSYLLKGILKTKKSNLKSAYFESLTQLKLITNHKQNRDLQYIKEIKLKHQYNSLNTSISKSAIVVFLAEVLLNSLKEEEPNEQLFSYLENTLLVLDSSSDFTNFHLLFLLKLTKYLGFYPNTTNVNYPYFNLEDGNFTTKVNSKNSVKDKNLDLLKQLLGINFDALNTIRISSKQRQAFLSMILLYFELHLGSFKQPKSLKVFNQVFN